MKKALSFLLALLVVVSFVGCKGSGDLGDVIAKDWKNQQAEGAVKTITLKADDYNITWFRFIEKNGDYGTVVTDFADDNTGTYAAITKGKSQTFTFDIDKRTEYVLYMYQADAVYKENIAGTYTYRGTVKAHTTQGTTIKASDWREFVDHVGEITITNDEPTTGSYFQHGDYTVTELWPLKVTSGNGSDTGSKFEVASGIKCTGLDFGKGKTLSFLMPEGDLFITTYQPGRTTYDKGSEYTYAQLKAEHESLLEACLADHLTEKKNEYWAKEVTVPAHDSLAEFTTDSMKIKLTKDGESFSRLAGDIIETYVIVESAVGEK